LSGRKKNLALRGQEDVGVDCFFVIEEGGKEERDLNRG